MTTKKRPRTLKEVASNTAPSSVVFHEPSARAFLDWSPDLIRSAELLAQSGSLRLAADLCEEMMADDRVSGVLSTLVQGLLGLPRQFEAGVGRRKHRAVRALEAEEDYDASFPENQVAQMLSWGQMLGVGLGQNVWRYRDNDRVIGEVRHYRERFLRFDTYTRTWRLIVDGSDEIEITPGDGRWVLYTPGGPYMPWLHGAWRGISRWWLLKQYAKQDWGLHGEVHGQPWRVADSVDAQEPVSEENRKQLAADLQSVGRSTSMVMPPGYKLSLIEAKARTWEMFQAQINMANAAITIILAGQNLTTEVSGGSLAAAQVHKEIRGDKIRAADETLSSCLHDQNLTFWAGYNFGDKALAPWPMHDTAPPEDVKAKGESLGALADAITKLDGALANRIDENGDPVAIDAVAILTKAGVPLIKRELAMTEEPEPETPDGNDSEDAADAADDAPADETKAA